MYPLQFFRPLPATRRPKPLKIGGQIAARMLRPASVQHRPQRILSVGSRAEHIAQPLVEEPRGAIDQLRPAGRQILLQVWVGPDVEQHPIGKAVVAVVIRPNSKIVVEPYRTLADAGQVG